MDYAHLESLIRTAIYEYDSDKTGMFDFALESAGECLMYSSFHYRESSLH